MTHVGIEPRTSRFGVQTSTTTPPRPLILFVATTVVEIESRRFEQPFVDIRFKSNLTVTHIFLKDPKRKSYIKDVKKVRSAVYQRI